MVRITKTEDPSNYLFIGCFFIGMGLGFWFGNLVTWTLLGLGVGFLTKFLFLIVSKKKK